MKRLATCLTALLLGATASGCLTVADDEGPLLSIELYWDERPNDKDFVAGTCNGADVEWMDWRLIRHLPDGEDEVVAEREEPCANAIDVVEPERGEYTLEITGRTEDGEELWAVECVDLKVLRFDQSYECDIESN